MTMPQPTDNGYNKDSAEKGCAMTDDEARELAVKKGALKPQGMLEGVVSGILAANWQRFSKTPRAQGRLDSWTQQILNGQEPKD